MIKIPLLSKISIQSLDTNKEEKYGKVFKISVNNQSKEASIYQYSEKNGSHNDSNFLWFSIIANIIDQWIHEISNKNVNNRYQNSYYIWNYLWLFLLILIIITSMIYIKNLFIIWKFFTKTLIKPSPSLI